MTEKRVAPAEPIVQEVPEHAPKGWATVQKSIADSAGLSLLLVDGYQPPALAVSNNNSICQALQSSPQHVGLCDTFCGVAHSRVAAENSVVHYRCHAGLQCFAIPVQIEGRRLSVIGGRAFVSSADYKKTAERFRTGDLRNLYSDDLFRNVIFADEADLDHAALRVSRAAREFGKEPLKEKASSHRTETVSADITERRRKIDPNRLLDRRAPFADSIRKFAEEIDATDPAHTYESILAQAADLVKAERASLLLFDEAANVLTVTAARGIAAPLNTLPPIQPGQGIAGAVLTEGRPRVGDIQQFGGGTVPGRGYKTRSFLSYPITIGNRKFGVLNLADKEGGAVLGGEDLATIELVTPQIALALERAAWQTRANHFQVMSITDPLTGLHNRRYLEARLAEELSRTKRYNYPLSFMMIDIDDFKLYNDRNGHQAGDRALEITADCLRATLRKVDVAARYGGEEFSILLPQTTLKEAGAIADRIRRQIITTSYPHGKAQPLGAVTVSIGLSAHSPALESGDLIVRAADRALYHAKSHGKNRAYAYQGAPKRTTRQRLSRQL
jgi:diguanylate cyclase (GGDEF)-like protein